MAFINLTANPVTIGRPNGNTIVVQPSGQIARTIEIEDSAGPPRISHCAVSRLPARTAKTKLIVTADVAAARPDRDDLIVAIDGAWSRGSDS